MHAANPPARKAYIVIGPTSGIGRLTAFELAQHGTVILVGRDRRKLDEVQKAIEGKGQRAVSVGWGNAKNKPRITTIELFAPLRSYQLNLLNSGTLSLGTIKSMRSMI